MVETKLLEVGTEAVTCNMAGRGMNGLKGTIVCYNHSNARYTVELGNGDMMSLRARNVRENYVSNKEEETRNISEENGNKKKQGASSPSGLPKYPKPSQNQQDRGEAAPRHATYKKNFVDKFVLKLFATIMDMSPSVVVLSIIAGWWLWPIFTITDTSVGARHYIGRWDYWGYGYGWGWGWGICTVSSIVSLGLCGFFCGSLERKRDVGNFRGTTSRSESKIWTFGK